MMKVRSSYLAFGRPNLSEEEVEAVARVMRSGWVGMGPETIAFEEELTATLGAPNVVTVNSCTSALFLALLVQGVGAGDEVICPSLTWCSSANAALYLGARPVFCDVDPMTLCATPATVSAVITSRTKAVIIVHFGGLAADVEALRDAIPKGIALIEDAAHAFGAQFPMGRPVGSSGNATCFSFYANKNLSAGDGGAIAIADGAKANRIRSLRQHALPTDAWKRFTHPESIRPASRLTELGYKLNFTDLQAALARVQLRRQPEFFRRRLAIARQYKRRLSPFRPAFGLQAGITSNNHARHLFTIILPANPLLPSRDELLRALRTRNIGATIHYAPLHLMPLYKKKPCLLPVTEHVGSQIMTLPISASMTVADADYVCDHLLELLGRPLIGK